ncbi:MAG: hypothetical protein OQJ98_01055 [Candidatus Pacebacteria bacterium]|nr:hypothetical protein [Candidatus Paceibacterota bacterium]
MLFTGDKFEEDKDYDFRMKFIYEELRQRNIRFVEFIRSLESWKTVLKHALKRRRPVIYSDSIVFIGRFISIISGGRRRAEQKFGTHKLISETDPENRFKYLVATQYLLTVYDDVWAIRIMEWILHAIGIRVALVISASERSFHTVLGCKLNSIPTVGIMHGVASRYGTPCDFMIGFDGKKMLSVDNYGVWSDWWKVHYMRNSQSYKPEQIHVSGPMRPLMLVEEQNTTSTSQDERMRVLFIAEQTADPSEVMLYLHKLLHCTDIRLTIKFRPYRDGFEIWLLENEPQILKLPHIKVVKGGMQEAIQNVDVVVGCHSTAVLEALLQLKVPIFLRTQKWGDYYSMTQSDKTRHLIAENPGELIEQIQHAGTITPSLLTELREQYFGDPHKNGSKWVVDQVEEILQKTN